MKDKRPEEIAVMRDYKITKANDIIQKARYDLSLQELKILAYCFSLIKPNDKEGQKYIFSMVDFCQICGITQHSGKNYETIKSTLKALRDKSFWLTKDNGDECLIGWLGSVETSRKSGKIAIRFDMNLEKYIHDLIGNFTQYSLLSTLPMKSAYSFRMYELLKSYAFQYTHTFTLEDLKKQIAAVQYTRYPDFRRRVLEPAVIEINRYTDIEVSFEPIKTGITVTEILFYIRQRDAWGQLETINNARQALDKKKPKPTPEEPQIQGQMNITDFV